MGTAHNTPPPRRRPLSADCPQGAPAETDGRRRRVAGFRARPHTAIASGKRAAPSGLQGGLLYRPGSTQTRGTSGEQRGPRAGRGRQENREDPGPSGGRSRDAMSAQLRVELSTAVVMVSGECILVDDVFSF